MIHKGFLVVLFLMGCLGALAQTSEIEDMDRRSYYERRAKQDAEYEQRVAIEIEENEADFWEDQEKYEKELKRRDRKAYRAYMRGKRDAYAEHAKECGSHCHHSDYYHHHATFYYNYYRNDKRNYPRRSTISTGIRVRSPRVRVGIL